MISVTVAGEKEEREGDRSRWSVSVRRREQWLVVSRGLRGLSYFSQPIRCEIFPGRAVTLSATTVSHI